MARGLGRKGGEQAAPVGTVDYADVLALLSESMEVTVHQWPARWGQPA
jgi:hypothetical protein